MRDLFETTPSGDPVAAARRGGRPPLPRRSYAKAEAATVADGPSVLHIVRLDEQSLRTPAGRLVAAPTLALAQAIAAEWQASLEVIDPGKMPLTRLANAIIDGVVDAPGPVAAEIEKYLASDLLFYRANSPRRLHERQARLWDPILAWARSGLGAQFKLGEGVIYVAQSEAALRAAGAAIPKHNDPWRLGAVHAVTTLTGSALIALAMLGAELSVEAAWQAAHVDEDWNMEQWGKDEMTLERRAFRYAEMQAAAMVLASRPAASAADRDVRL
jgi:chaperone required for assembly of F1-ATPase